MDTYRASRGTLNAQRTNNSFFSLEKKRHVNHVGPDSHFHWGRLSKDTESLLLFSNLVVVFIAGIKKTTNISNCKSKEMSESSQYGCHEPC